MTKCFGLFLVQFFKVNICITIFGYRYCDLRFMKKFYEIEIALNSNIMKCF